MKLDDTKERIKLTKKERYGDETYNNQEKSKDTCITRYGVPYVLQSSIVRDKIEETNLQRYGVKTAIQSPTVQQKSKETCKINYGRNSYSQIHLSLDTLEKMNNRDWLIEQHHIQQQPIYRIAEILGVSNSHLCKKYHEHDIEIKQFYCSELEKEVANFVVSLSNSENVEFKNRTIISPKELDIYIKDKKIAIEVNGVFYHSEYYLEKKYHQNKTQSCAEKGIRLIQIFENEWNTKKEIVKSMLSSALGYNTRLFARNYSVNLISAKQANAFYENNHIQGSCNSSINLGLVDLNDILVACMSFSKSRFNKSTQFELTRYCSLINHNVIGGSSKLFTYFIKSYHPESIVSYCDKRFFTGDMYAKLGFTHSHESEPNYFYFFGGETNILYTREIFQKHKLKNKLQNFNEELSEWENMKNNGYNRIWDCGNFVFLWSSK